MHSIPHRQRGAVLIMVALAMLVLLSLVGLVIDGGLAYLVKARLNAAVDSAALAAARAVSEGSTRDIQIDKAEAAADKFFAANIQPNYLLSQPKLVDKQVTFLADGTITIDLKATAEMPVSLMRLLGFHSLTPVAFAQTVRKDLDMVLVVDTSGSLQNVGSSVKTSAKNFLSKFNIAQDRIGLVHFGYGAQIDAPIKKTGRGFSRIDMNSKIDTYKFDGMTASVEGMWQARQQLKDIKEKDRSTLRVIVFFSDGAPNAIGARLNFKNNCSQAGVLDSDLNGLYALDKSSASSLGIDCKLYSQNWFWKIPNTDELLPAWYNAHDDLKEFPIVTGGALPVTNALTSNNVARAAINLPQAVADKARDEGVIVFTLGMGAELKNKVAGAETGEDILKCMANVPDAPKRCYRKEKPVGMYCYAATDADLTPCFSRLASAILRISQ